MLTGILFDEQKGLTIYNPNILFMTGDTIIVGKTYQKLLENGYRCVVCPSDSFNTTGFNQYKGAIRQDSTNKKIYFCQPDSTHEDLLYDFNLSIGDTLPLSYNNFGNNYVSSIDSALWAGRYRKQYHISTSGHSNYVSLVEGVGSTEGLIYPLNTGPWGNINGTLNGFSLDKIVCDTSLKSLSVKQINNSGLKYIIYPNPVNSLLQVSVSNETLSQIKIVDVLGNEIMVKPTLSPSTGGELLSVDVSNLANGVYFIRIGASTQKFIVQH